MPKLLKAGTDGHIVICSSPARQMCVVSKYGNKLEHGQTYHVSKSRENQMANYAVDWGVESRTHKNVVDNEATGSS